MIKELKPLIRCPDDQRKRYCTVSTKEAEDLMKTNSDVTVTIVGGDLV
jgi:hypothetical protein